MAKENPVISINENHIELARRVADRIVETIEAARAAGRAPVLGLATGSTPIGVYAELVRRHREEGLSFHDVVTFNLDEYFPMSPESLHSYHRFMQEHLFGLVDLDPQNAHVPRGDVSESEVASAAAAYEEAIRRHGGIDLQVLGLGRTGHIGFNEPGSPADSRTRLIELDAVTRRDAAADFFGEDNVPRQAVTMGVGTIMAAREVVVIATGEHKAGIVRQAIEGQIDPQVPATFLQAHPRVSFYLDTAAAEQLTAIATPWLVGPVEWTPALVVRAVVWLSHQTGKAILKLTRSDYAEHKLGALVNRYPAPGVLNGEVFNVLGAKIRGRSKLPRGKTIICFSPHPDDDVISMGGILRKLVENDNQIVVAYMTSGNIAVFDHDVQRHLDFLRRLASERYLPEAPVDALTAEVDASLARKHPGDIDIDAVLDIKRLIRASEAIAGIGVLGLPPAAGRFLDLPFYQTGTVKKAPIGPDDVALVGRLLAEVNPDLVFVAGDLSDPHGTHRMCKEAIDRALIERSERGDGMPEVWLYRGAWQEWAVTDATWLVPLSQEELKLKIHAIFKHQSQKDTAPFPGNDEREFWQRVEARNKGTAEELNRLGLAEYFAMEAFVVSTPQRREEDDGQG